MQINGDPVLYQVSSSAARCSIVVARSKRLTLIQNAPTARSLKQDTDATSAVLLWCRGRLQRGSIDRRAVNDAFTGIVLSVSVVNTFDAARFTRINLNPYR